MMEIEAPPKTAGMGRPATPPAPAALTPETAAHAGPGWAPLAVGLSSATLAACGGGGGGGDAVEAPPAIGVVDFPVNTYAHSAPVSDADAARFLQQAQFSSTSQEIAALRGSSYAQWLANQFANHRGTTGWNWLEARGYSAVDLNSYFFSDYPADFMIWSQLMSGPDAARRRMALALSEFFVVSLTTSEFTWRSHAMAHWWDTLVGQAFGNFRQLLEAVSLHPVMGYFLNTKGNQKENTRTGRVPDENYAREVMQLFSIGLYELNLDGSEKTDGQGKRIDSYTQSDVTNLARVFTGYDFDRSDGVRITVPNQTYTIETRDFARKPMLLNPSRHSTLEATFLGTTIPADTPAAEALKTALDTLFNHPNVGPFFARQMIQRLVTSQPSAGYVARVAARFNDNGSGVRGDLRAVWAAILLDDEARGPQSLVNPAHGKLREPMLRFVQWARSFGATSAAGSWKIFELGGASNQLGQSPLRPPSVFNFFRPGYVPPATALADVQATAPEFQLVNETSVGGYLNFMQNVILRGINCPEPTVPQAAYTNYLYDVKASYAAELTLVTDAAELVRHLSLVMCAGQLSATTQTIMVTALNATPVTAASTDAVKLNRVAAAVLMVMACAEYLIQK